MVIYLLFIPTNTMKSDTKILELFPFIENLVWEAEGELFVPFMQE